MSSQRRMWKVVIAVLLVIPQAIVRQMLSLTHFQLPPMEVIVHLVEDWMNANNNLAIPSPQSFQINAADIICSGYLHSGPVQLCNIYARLYVSWSGVSGLQQNLFAWTVFGNRHAECALLLRHFIALLRSSRSEAVQEALKSFIFSPREEDEQNCRIITRRYQHLSRIVNEDKENQVQAIILAADHAILSQHFHCSP